MRKSATDRSLHGVCGGIAEHFGISPFLVRLPFILCIPTGLIIYIILDNLLLDTPKSL
ncbi:PspC domain-containing protein [Gracilibacillus salitolerans]|uniref:PspC domain-containing protein n=1 Tax=Gracilibacillus salitolerans TaxID=2663022 RepID=UPI001E50D1FF|nr:PspC domain-containing protein [Gracilibacillus salitolerans]